jgi:peptidoglycan-N-acetylglucosamine deacetylase
VTTAVFRAIAGLAIMALAAPAAAGNWPTPAAGASRSGAPEVVFTFDDGPDERTTPIILEALARHQVQAIFFWVGHRVSGTRRGTAARREVVERAVADGHLIGNHTVSHAKLCSGSEEEAGAEIDRNQAIYAELTRLPLHLFRTPYGSRCARLDAQLAARGLGHLHWDIDPQEFLGKTAQQTADYVTGKLRRLDGRAVVLMHDTKRATAQAVPIILEWIAAENARRVADGRPAIRVLAPSDLVAEGLDQALASLGRDAVAAARAALLADLRRLVPVLDPRLARDTLRGVSPWSDKAPGQ